MSQQQELCVSCSNKGKQKCLYCYANCCKHCSCYIMKESIWIKNGYNTNAYKCGYCRKFRLKSAFSKSQLKKKAARKCKPCIDDDKLPYRLPICRTCVNTLEYELISNAIYLNSTMDYVVIKLITEFSIGSFITCSKSGCNTEISFDSAFQYEHKINECTSIHDWDHHNIRCNEHTTTKK